MLSPQPTLKLFCQLNPTAFFPAGYVPTNTKIREPDYHLDNPSPGNASFQGFFMYLLIHTRHQYNTLNGITKDPQSSRQLYQRNCGLRKQRWNDTS